MENLLKEKIKSKDNQETQELLEKDNSSQEEDTQKNKEEDNQKNKEEDDDIQKKTIITDFTEEVELTEEEKKLRKSYLKKHNKKEVICRSITLSKKRLYYKIFTYIIGVMRNIVDFRQTKYKSETINGITEKNMEIFITSLKYYILYIVFDKLISIIEFNFRQFFMKRMKINNVLLENLLLKKDMEFFDLFKTGELINKINEFCDYPYFDCIETAMNAIKNIFKICYLGYNLYTKFLSMSIITIVILLIQMFLEPFAFGVYRRENFIDKSDLKHNYVNDVVANIRLVKSFSTEKKELKRIFNVNNAMENIRYCGNMIANIHSYTYEVNDILMLYICGKKTITGDMKYGDLLVFKQFSSQFKFSIRNLKDQFRSTFDGLERWKEFLSIYDIEQKIKSEKNIIPEIKNNNKNNGLSVDLKNVNFSYPTKKNVTILKNLSMKILPGMNTAIVGSSGSGKTTISNLLLRFYDVDKGEILINNINIKDLNLEWLRNSIGIVSQEPILTSGTIKENILYGVENYTEKKFNEVCKLSNVYSFVSDKKLFPKGYETIVGERGIKVSGGQKQRIAIARALMKDAKILIFDEATSALDAENEALVQNAINNIINQKHITTIIIAHRLSTIKNADMIYVMNHGSVVENGKHDELIKMDKEYKKLIQRQLVN